MMHILRRFSLQTRAMVVFTLAALFILGMVLIAINQYRTIQDLLNIEGDKINPLFQQSRIFFAIFLLCASASVISLAGSLVMIVYSIQKPLEEIEDSIISFQFGKKYQNSAEGLPDELGKITGRLKQLLNEVNQSYVMVEERVSQRTDMLAKRANQLQAAAEVARDTVSISDFDILLQRVVQIIMERFELYFVAVYLIDADGQLVVLRSATGEIGNLLLQRSHKYQVGESGLVGYVAAAGETRVINNAELDFVYRRNNLLPETRSEAALPLRIGPQVIGVLDIHSNRFDQFQTEDLSVLQIIADQLAISVHNASLAANLQDRIREMQTLYQRYAQESWAQTQFGDNETGYEYDIRGISPGNELIPNEVLKRLKSGQSVYASAPDNENPSTSTLYTPLMMYNQLIGVMGIEDAINKRDWTDEELSVIEALSNQVALALDNARLLEETQKRSDQLRLLQEVTSVAASHGHVVELLQAVAEKLKQGLKVDCCDVFGFDEEDISAYFTAGSSENDMEPTPRDWRFSIIDNPLLQQLIEQKTTFVIYDIGHNPILGDLHQYVSLKNLESIIAVPFTKRGEVNGVILMGIQDRSRKITEEETNLLDQISLQISSALEVARSFEQATLRAEREKLVSEATRRIRETLDVNTILRTAAQELRSVLDFPDVMVRLSFPDSNDSDKSSDTLKPENELIAEDDNNV